MMIPISSAILIAMVASYGSEAVAAFGVGKRIESIAIILILALSMSLSPFVSQNFGANQLQRVKQAYFSGIKFVLIWQMLIYILLCLSADTVANWFADEPEVANLISVYLVFIPVTHGLVGMAVLSNSTLNALQKSTISLRLNIFRLFWCLLPFSYIGSSVGGVKGVIIGVVCATGVSGVVSFYFMLKELNKLEQ
jgi:Na+-driven multidrug efflux pump